MNVKAATPPSVPADGVVEFSEATRIAVDAARVWRALTDPSEVVLWDTGVERPLEIATDYPQPGQAARWRYELGPLRLTLRDFPIEVVEKRTFRSRIRLGPFCFDETYSLHEITREGGAAETRLTAKLVLWSEVPLLGSLLTRWVGRPIAASVVRHSLKAIRGHCEAPG